MYRFYYHPRYTRTRALKSTQKKSITIGELSGQYYFGQKGQSYCSQRGQSCLAKRVKVAWLFHLIKNGINEKSKYNQIANYTYLDTQVNKAVRDDSPNIYFSKVFEQCETGIAVYGNITDKELLLKNLQQNCIPETILQMEYTDYEEFLTERRKLMAKKIKKYYYSL